MQLRVVEQLSIGAWLSMAAAFAILSRSPETAGLILIMGGIVMLPLLAMRGITSARKPLRWLSVVIVAAVTALMVIGLLSVIERVYVVNGSSYPSWLASGKLGDVDDAAVDHLRATACQNKTIEIFQKDHFVVLRCGFAWYEPSTRTFIADSYNFGEKP
jgi:hypothetical protein